MSLVNDAGNARKHAHAHDRLIPIREAGKIVGLCKSTIYERIRAGEFPKPVKLGKLTRFSLHEVEAYVAALLAGRGA